MVAGADRDGKAHVTVTADSDVQARVANKTFELSSTVSSSSDRLARSPFTVTTADASRRDVSYSGGPAARLDGATDLASTPTGQPRVGQPAACARLYPSLLYRRAGLYAYGSTFEPLSGSTRSATAYP